MSGHVELSTRAIKDLRRLDPSTRDRVTRVLRADLVADLRAPNLDVVQLEGRAPWSRLRVGDHRVIFRPLTAAELRALGATQRKGILVERLINRRDLEKAIRHL